MYRSIMRDDIRLLITRFTGEAGSGWGVWVMCV
jgi:hypothetical protein